MEEAARFVDADDAILRADLGVHAAGRDGGVVDVLPLPVGPHRRLPRPRPRLVHLRLGTHPHRAGQPDFLVVHKSFLFNLPPLCSQPLTSHGRHQGH